ncbi:thiamine diphosphokinase [Clostridium magnum]|uniref:Thiamine diphosphokinase n=1 Tax=Clostridium magnum DSM 2767 TaxID=1121326 RepID=A0A162UZP9_9CLOT|nr:thiamine diphosphokinase [Clostridium magnum]KZL94437.1 thiamine pyrophosphokinase [Clostridium magnum DSM 2767]SHI22211.1 thiamine pyrophosphokinase [Clostridium magnum DSM 2767]
MKILIVSGGSPPSYELIKEELKDSSFLICADSGGECLYKYNIIPNFLMGDFDSISLEALEFFRAHEKCTIDTYPKDKDFTDTELVLNKAAQLGASEIVFLGCTGTRMDHFMGNMGMLLKCLKLNIKAYIKDNNNIIEITDKPIRIKKEKGTTFSLQAYCDKVKDLNIRGAKFELENYDLTLGDPRTVSNEFLNNDVDIDFKSGILLIFYSKD